MAEVQLIGVSKAYGRAQVLHDLTLTIPRGALAVVVGPSGCGKSSLLRMIAGLEPVTAGELRLDGLRANDIPPGRRDVAMVFQSYALYPHLTVRDNLAFSLRIAGLPRAQIGPEVARIAESLQLTPLLDRMPAALSGGQRQRVAIGRALIRNPRLWLFDEPLSNLDAGLRAALRVEIARLKARLPDRTMIHVTHDQQEAMVLADLLVVLEGGRIAQAGPPLEVYLRPRSVFVAGFLGAPGMGLLPARITATGAVTRLTLAGGGEVACPLPSCAGDLGRAVQLGVRPEDLRPCDAPGLICGRVDLVEVLGDASLLHLTTPEGPVIAKLPGIHAGLRGQVLNLTADPDRLHVFLDGLSLALR